MPVSEPHDVQSIRQKINQALNSQDSAGRVVGNAKYGVYAFYDYDGEPIYVGQTSERLRTRIRRHLTNQRTDAVAMNVLDPFEVAEIEVWPLYFTEENKATANQVLNAAEHTVFEHVLSNSRFHAVLNEKNIPTQGRIELPESHRYRIIPDDIYEQRKHSDVRIARRAQTISNLARVISERSVSKGLRQTLLVQARRLENLAERRLEEVGDTILEEEENEQE